MSTIARLAPLRTSDRLIANPRPLAPPVMTAVLSASENAGNVGRKVALCVYLAGVIIPPGERSRLKVVFQRFSLGALDTRYYELQDYL